MLDKRMSWDVLNDSFFVTIYVLQELISYLARSDHEVIKVDDSLAEWLSTNESSTGWEVLFENEKHEIF